MDREKLDTLLERGILGLVLAILVVGPAGGGGVHAPIFLVIQGLTVLVLGLWVARVWMAPRLKLLWPPICWVVIAFTGYFIWRYFTADIEYLARQELIRVLIYTFLFLAVVNNLHRQDSVQIIGFTVIFLAMAISGYAVYQFMTGSDAVWHMHRYMQKRASGTFFSANNLAGFLELVLPLGLAYSIAGRMKPVTRILIVYATLVSFAGLIVTVSRGGWLAAGVSLVLFFGILVTQRRYRLAAIVSLALIIGAAAWVGPKSVLFQKRVKQALGTEGEPDDSLRYTLWKPAVQIWKQDVWFGSGPGHFNERFRMYRPELVQMQPDRAHNDYLNTLADLGVVGLSLIALALAFLCAGVVKTWKSVRNTGTDLGGKSGSNKFGFLLGGTTAIAAILVHSLVDFNMHVPANAILVITLMALLSSNLRFATESFWCSARGWMKVALSILLSAGIVYLGAQGWRRAQEYRWQVRAEFAPNFSDEKIGFLKQAFAAEPGNWATAEQIGEAYRIQSSEGGVDTRELAKQAAEWFERGMRLNPWKPNSFWGYGWCLDWLGEAEKARSFYLKAGALDPNNYEVLNRVGLHYVHNGRFASALPYFERSQRLMWEGNPTAVNYVQICRARMSQNATNDFNWLLQRAEEKPAIP